MISIRQRMAVYDRSGMQCEVMVEINDVWTRCWQRPVELHHMLTRARGGNALDDVGEIYHLIALCPVHHRMADGGEAYEAGLLIDGYAINKDGRVIYQGTDDYLKETYGAPDQSDQE